MPNSNELRKLAAWYREFAQRAGNPAIWGDDCAPLNNSKPKPTGPSPKLSRRRRKRISGERVVAPEREQDIRERAYAIWEQEGRPDGNALDH
jgi:Protein of unknown function (DUF2934)